MAREFGTVGSLLGRSNPPHAPGAMYRYVPTSPVICLRRRCDRARGRGASKHRWPAHACAKKRRSGKILGSFSIRLVMYCSGWTGSADDGTSECVRSSSSQVVTLLGVVQLACMYMWTFQLKEQLKSVSNARVNFLRPPTPRHMGALASSTHHFYAGPTRHPTFHLVGVVLC